MANKKETAEQKLLKMIEASATPVEPAAQSQKQVSNNQSVLSFTKTLNKILIVGAVIAAAWLANEIWVGAGLLSEKFKASVPKSLTDRSYGVESSIPTIQKLSFYLASLDRRNLFKPFEEKIPENVVVVENNRKIVQKTAGLRLVGIAWLDRVDTASAMIEDTSKGATYFLQRGEKVDDITVKTIYADSVELGYENEEIIIRYDKSQM